MIMLRKVMGNYLIFKIPGTLTYSFFFLDTDKDPYHFCLDPDPYQSSSWTRIRIRNKFFTSWIRIRIKMIRIRYTGYLYVFLKIKNKIIILLLAVWYSKRFYFTFFTFLAKPKLLTEPNFPYFHQKFITVG